MSVDIHQQRIAKIVGWMPSWIVTFSLLFIAIGQFSDSIEMLEKASDAAISNFTHTPEYEKIAQLNVHSTYKHVEQLMGTAPISKVLPDDLAVDYYIKESHVVAVIHDEKRVKAYYVQALVDDFSPNFKLPSADQPTLGEVPFREQGENIEQFSLDFSRNQNFYIESFDLSSSGLYYSFIQGYSGKDAYAHSMIQALYEKELFGQDSKEELSELRSKVSPNIYGFGTLSAEQLNMVLLTERELKTFSNEH